MKKKLLIIMLSMFVTIGSISAKESYGRVIDFYVDAAVVPKTGIEYGHSSIDSMFSGYSGTWCDIPEDKWYRSICFTIFCRIDF